MKKIFILTLLLINFLSGCSLAENDKDLGGFIYRLNSLNEDYNMTATGFIYSESSNDIYKFFVINETEVFLSFKADDKGRLTEMNFVAERNFYENTSAYNFFKEALYSFINNETVYLEIINTENLSDFLKENVKETVKINSGNIEILLDVTTIGTVISVYFTDI